MDQEAKSDLSKDVESAIINLGISTSLCAEKFKLKNPNSFLCKSDLACADTVIFATQLQQVMLEATLNNCENIDEVVKQYYSYTIKGIAKKYPTMKNVILEMFKERMNYYNEIIMKIENPEKTFLAIKEEFREILIFDDKNQTYMPYSNDSLNLENIAQSKIEVSHFCEILPNLDSPYFENLIAAIDGTDVESPTMKTDTKKSKEPNRCVKCNKEILNNDFYCTSCGKIARWKYRILAVISYFAINYIIAIVTNFTYKGGYLLGLAIILVYCYYSLKTKFRKERKSYTGFIFDKEEFIFAFERNPFIKQEYCVLHEIDDINSITQSQLNNYINRKWDILPHAKKNLVVYIMKDVLDTPQLDIENTNSKELLSKIENILNEVPEEEKEKIKSRWLKRKQISTKKSGTSLNNTDIDTKTINEMSKLITINKSLVETAFIAFGKINNIRP